MNTYECDRAEGMLLSLDDAARRSEDYRRRAVSAGVKPQKAAARAKASMAACTTAWSGITTEGCTLRPSGITRSRFNAEDD